MSKAKKAKDLSINTMLFAVSTFSTKLISFLLVPLYTYVLSTSDYGTLDLIGTTVCLLVPVLTVNIQDAVLRFSLDKRYDPTDIGHIGLKIIGYASLFLAPVLFIIYRMQLFSIDPIYIGYLYLSFITGSLHNVLSMYLKAANYTKLLVVCSIICTFVHCMLNILFLLVFRLGITGYMAAGIISSVLGITIKVTRSNILSSSGSAPDRALMKEMIRYSAPIILNSAAWWINASSDRYIVTYFCGTAANGIYSVAYKIPAILSNLQTVFFNAWSISAITDFDKDDKDGFIGNVYTTYSCGSMLICSFIMLLNIPIAKILYAKDFFSAWQYVPALLYGTMFSGIALVEWCLFTSVKKTKEVSLTTLLGTAVNTVCNFILIPVIGALGAAIATMFGYVLIWLVRTLALRKIIRMQVNWKTQTIGHILLFIQCAAATILHNIYIQIPIMILIIISQNDNIKKVIDLVLNRLKRRKAEP